MPAFTDANAEVAEGQLSERRSWKVRLYFSWDCAGIKTLNSYIEMREPDNLNTIIVVTFRSAKD